LKGVNHWFIDLKTDSDNQNLQKHVAAQNKGHSLYAQSVTSYVRKNRSIELPCFLYNITEYLIDLKN
jgi:hypothetical protein